MVGENSAVSFCHVHHEANKVADSMENVGMDGGRGNHRSTLDDFCYETWTQQCRQMVTCDYEVRPQVEHVEDGNDGDDRGR